jgi:hypothetical protein
MRMIHNVLLGLAATASSSIALAGHSELRVPPADTFMLGGEQNAPMTVSGRNSGKTTVVIAARRGSTDATIVTVMPGGTFDHIFALGETALIRNLSTRMTATLSVDFTGSPSDLSMRYANPPTR